MDNELQRIEPMAKTLAATGVSQTLSFCMERKYLQKIATEDNPLFELEVIDSTSTTGEIVKFLSAGLLRAFSMLMSIKTLCESEKVSCSFMSNSIHGQRSLAGYNPWDSPGKNTGVGCIPFSRGSFRPRDQTQVSHIVGRFFTV